MRVGVRVAVDRIEQDEVKPGEKVPYGLHPMIDLILMMNSLADNQCALAKNQQRIIRTCIIAYSCMFVTYLLLFTAYWLRLTPC